MADGDFKGMAGDGPVCHLLDGVTAPSGQTQVTWVNFAEWPDMTVECNVTSGTWDNTVRVVGSNSYTKPQATDLGSPLIEDITQPCVRACKTANWIGAYLAGDQGAEAGPVIVRVHGHKRPS